jgi:hypothetical protein
MKTKNITTSKYTVAKAKCRMWAVWSQDDCGKDLVCYTVYRRGAREVAKRLNLLDPLRSL